MNNFKKQYRDLEQRVLRELREKVEASNEESVHMDARCLKVDLEHFTELVVVNDRLTFLDKDGLHYNIFTGGANLEDLIDILGDSQGVTYVCPECGSKDIEYDMWVQVNTGKIMSDGPEESYWCPNCGTHFKEVVEKQDYELE